MLDKKLGAKTNTLKRVEIYCDSLMSENQKLLEENILLSQTLENLKLVNINLQKKLKNSVKKNYDCKNKGHVKSDVAIFIQKQVSDNKVPCTNVCKVLLDAAKLFGISIKNNFHKNYPSSLFSLGIAANFTYAVSIIHFKKFCNIRASKKASSNFKK